MLKNKRYVAGISWRLFGSLIIFVTLILIVIWIFQVVLLNRFYENSKLEEFGYIKGTEIIEDYKIPKQEGYYEQ